MNIGFDWYESYQRYRERNKFDFLFISDYIDDCEDKEELIEIIKDLLEEDSE